MTLYTGNKEDEGKIWDSTVCNAGDGSGEDKGKAGRKDEESD